MIEPLAARLSSYFHFFGVRGALLMQLGRCEEARVAFDRAIALANTLRRGRPYPDADRPAQARRRSKRQPLKKFHQGGSDAQSVSVL